MPHIRSLESASASDEFRREDHSGLRPWQEQNEPDVVRFASQLARDRAKKLSAEVGLPIGSSHYCDTTTKKKKKNANSIPQHGLVECNWLGRIESHMLIPCLRSKPMFGRPASLWNSRCETNDP